MHTVRLNGWLLTAAIALLPAGAAIGDAACGCFSAKDAPVLQTAEQAFITWDPRENVETITIQPRVEGSAADFAIVVPTPSRPKLDTMPRDFFKHLAVYTTLKQRKLPQSRLLTGDSPAVAAKTSSRPTVAAAEHKGQPKQPAVAVLDAGAAGSLKYEVFEASRAEDLFRWLQENHYSYAGSLATLSHYVQKRWVFTVLKIDARKTPRDAHGRFVADVEPIRFQFASDKLVYPLKISQPSAKDKSEVVLYVQAPYKVDLPDAHSYQYTWVPMLEAARRHSPDALPRGAGQWLETYKEQIPDLRQRAEALDYGFAAGRLPQPNRQGRVPTALEWARRLTDEDLGVITGQTPYTEKLLDVDEGFTAADLNNAKRGQAVKKAIEERLARSRQERPGGYLVRPAPKKDAHAMQELDGHLQAALFLTKLRKTFTRDEMNDDLLIVPARYDNAVDESEYDELLSIAPPG